MANQPQPLPVLSFIEFSKTLIDFVKHIMTLASGSIVLIATFSDKFSKGHGTGFLAWAFICLTVSIFVCTVFVIQLLLFVTKPGKQTLQNERSLSRTLVAGIILFSFGLTLIGIFTSLNF
jgi:hydrogenase-4 membrane subunit HyfE